MKTNMCVTIDEEIHSWLKRQPEKLSRSVNGLLRTAMFADIRSRAVKSGRQSTLIKMVCPTCEEPGNQMVRGCQCLADLVVVE